VHQVRVTLTETSDLELLFEQEAKRLWRALLAYSGDREIADDAMAEAFAQALARGSQIRSPQRWIWRAAFRIAAGELKTRGQHSSLVESGYEMAEPPLDLIAALSKLSPRQRAVLILRYYAGYPTKEIAAILGSTAPTVRVHLSQGRRRLRRLLEANHG
jgi:RNA polymerase sigma factor (sigma-70 family)